MEIIKQPRKLHPEYKKNPQRFLRDFCNISGESDSPFIVFPEKIDKAFTHGIDNPYSDATLRFSDDWEIQDIEKVRYMHLDLSKNKCATGLSMCYCPFFVEGQVEDRGVVKQIQMPFVKFDFVGAIKSAPGEEIKIDDVEEIIYDLGYRGIKFGLITFDRFASLQMKQHFQSKGYVCVENSIERTANKIVRVFRDTTHPEGIKRVSTNRQYLEGFTSFKELLYGDRIAMPFHPILRKEIRQARIDFIKNRVDKLPNGSIDMFHSACGSAYNLLNNVRFAEEDTLLDDPKMQDPFYAKHNINRETITEESESARTGYVEDSFYIQDDYLDDIYL